MLVVHCIGESPMSDVIVYSVSATRQFLPSTTLSAADWTFTWQISVSQVVRGENGGRWSCSQDVYGVLRTVMCVFGA